MKDISVIVAYNTGLRWWDIHYNRLKSSETLDPPELLLFDEFLVRLKERLNSTLEHVVPLPGASSADVVGFQPKEVALTNHPSYPVEAGEFAQVQALISEIESEWKKSSSVDVTLTPDEEKDLGN